MLGWGNQGWNRNDAGTKFRLFPRPPYVHPEEPPELVHVSTPPGLIGPGPSDDRLFVINPIGKRRPYGINFGPRGTAFLDLPPWEDPIRPPVQPSADGHFDHIPVDTPEFAEAHVFGAIRFVLEIWEGYFGRPIGWHFARDFDRLEVVLLPSLNNAQVGYGYMEVGAAHRAEGTLLPFALNFDVIAHELGHLIIYSTLGIPNKRAAQGEYFGFQESAADITALIAALHFESLLDNLLEDTHGNLYTFNELDRFAELSATEQIRLASNSVKLSQFAAGWADEHELSQPLTGAFFDILVDIFQENLVERGLIGREAADMADLAGRHPEYGPTVQSILDAAFIGEREAFRAALIEARDYFGAALAETWKRLSPDFFTYIEVAEVLLAVDRALSGGRYRNEIIESFVWREIGSVTVGPRLKRPDESSHAFSDRTIVPDSRRHLPKMTYHEQMLLARGDRMRL